MTASDTQREPAGSPALERSLAWAGLALVAIGAAAFRLRTLSLPLERDEGGYAYLGQRMLLGDPPFASGYSMHMPGTAATYAAAIAAFGPSIEGVRLGLLVAHLVAILFAFLLGRTLYGWAGAVACSLAYATLSAFPEVHGFFGHATQFVSLFGLSGLWAFAKGVQGRDPRWLALAGLLLGLAPVMKQSGAVFPAFALSWLAWARWREPGGWPRGAWKELVILGVSATAPLALTLALLAHAGVLGVAWRWMFSYAGSYSSMQSVGAGAAALASRAVAIGAPGTGFLALALAGLIVTERAGAGSSSLAGRSFLLVLLAFSFLGVLPGLYFRHHYFIAMLPVVSLACGRAAAEGFRRGAREVAIIVVALLAATALAVVTHRELLFAWKPLEISREVYGANPFPESIEVARYIRDHSAPGDRIAVLGSEPQIYFYAGRRSATRYLYLYPLLEPNPFGPEMKQELIAEVEAARPRFVVWVNTFTSWDTRVGAARPVVAWAEAFLDSGYELAGRVAIRGPRQTDYAWDEEARRLGPGGASVLVFRRVVP